MEQNGQQPDGGEIVVTGATGGVGSLAIDMLTRPRLPSRRGHGQAVLRRVSAGSSVRRACMLRGEIDIGSRPLEEARWGGAIDNVGGELLTWLTRTTNFWGNIASIGMASSVELRSTVLPFILRGVSLLGINSVFTPRALRLEVWQRLASDLKPRHLDRIVTRTIDFDALPTAFEDYLKAGVTGRTVVRIAP